MKYHFSWFQLAEPLIHAIEHAGATHDDAIRVVTSWGICIGLLLVALVARAGLKSIQAKGGTEPFVPGKGLGLAAFVEALALGQRRNLRLLRRWRLDLEHRRQGRRC